MPVVTVAAPPLPQRRALLTAIADAIATALSLGAGDVVVLAQETAETATSGGGKPGTWISAAISGSSRDERAMTAARDAAERSVRDWAKRAHVEVEGVWVTWSLP